MTIESDAEELASAQPTHDMPDEASGHMLVPRFRILVVKGPDAGAELTSAAERTVIGTHESADLVLHDTAVSRFHCELRVAEGKVALRDLGSRNGTVIDGTPIVEAFVRPGAQIAIGHTELRIEARSDKATVPLSSHDKFGLMIGGSVAMRKVFAVLERAAPNDATVLLEGETGTGKEVAAESIHRESKRADQPFIVVDCGAIPAELLESELFGHERGAFTGALQSRKGALEAAHGGTLFLDEIGELGLELQPKILRALERREIKRVGTNEYFSVDVRIIAATNRSLKLEVNERRFRSDLYYRLAVVSVRLPPLRERPDDIPRLAEHLLTSLGDGPSVEALRNKPFLDELSRHRWPGNVRELRNHLERCVALNEQVPLGLEDAALPDTATLSVDFSQPLKIARERCNRAFERAYLKELLARHGDNVAAAARAAGVGRMYLYRLLWRYGFR